MVSSDYFKPIDTEKLRTYLSENNMNRSEICEKAFTNRHFFGDVIRRGRARINTFNACCDAMGVPRDYFDKAEEPEPEPTAEPEQERECLVDLADIQLSLNKIEALLLEGNKLLSEQNRLLRGKLEKGERGHESKGFTNSGPAHSYTTSGLRFTP